MQRYEVAIDISKPEHVDAMILGLVHQGYNVYYNEDEMKLCFTATEENVTALSHSVITPMKETR